MSEKDYRKALLTVKRLSRATGGGVGDNPNFNNWFSGSAATDPSGQPMKLYHGTTGDFSSFDTGTIGNENPLSFGFHLTSRPLEASTYADSIDNAATGFNPNSKFGKPVRSGANVMPVYAAAKNPLVLHSDNAAASMTADLDKADIIHKLYHAKKAGKPYDSVIIHRRKGDEYDHSNVIVFHPNQIKSAIGNNGKFDPSSSDITRAQGGRLNRDTGGDARLKGAIDNFGQQRQQGFNRPANGSQSAALGLDTSYANPPQLLVADPPQQQRSNSQGMAAQTADLGSALDDGIGMLTGRSDAKPAAAKGAPATATTAPQGQPNHPVSATPPSKDQQGAAFNMIDRLVKIHGWTPEAASIAAGNAMQESSFNPAAGGDPSIPGGSHGMFQWNRDRLANLQNFAQQQGTSWQDPNTQIDYFAQEAKKMVPDWPSQTDLSQARPISKAYEGYGVEGNRVPDAQNIYKAYQNRPQPAPTGTVSSADIPQDDSVPQAKRGGFMRKHFDDGGSSGDGGDGGGDSGDSAGDSAATAAGAAAGFGGVGDAAGAPAGTSTNSGVTGFGGVGSDGPGNSATGFSSSVGMGSPNGAPNGVSAGFGHAGGGGNGSTGGVGGVGGNSAAGTAASASSGGGGTGGNAGGTSGSSAGQGGAPGSGGTSATVNNSGPANSPYAQALRNAIAAHGISADGQAGNSVNSLGVPPGVLSGVATATTPVTVSNLAPPATNPYSSPAYANAIASLKAGLAAQATHGQGYGNAGFGGGSPGEGVGQGTVGFNTSPTGAEGVSTAGLGAATSAPAATADAGVNAYANQVALAQAVRGTPAPGPAPAQQQQEQQAPPAPATAGNNGDNSTGGRYGFSAPVNGEHRSHGGIVKRASGGITKMPTNEMVARAMQIIARHKAASGGSQKNTNAVTVADPLANMANVKSGQPATLQDLYGSAPGSSAMNPSGNGDMFAADWGGFMGPSGAIAQDALLNGTATPTQSGDAAAASAAPITPALAGQTIGNASGAGGAPLGITPMASPTGGQGMPGSPSAASGTPTYSNTLNEALGTNSPTSNQVFGFNYPVPPPSKPQPQGPVSQAQINAEYGVGDGSQIGTGVFASGGAIIMDALTRANRQRKAKGKR